MNNDYEFYIKIIKPLEKKYNQMCTLYSLFKLEKFRTKRNQYNNLLNYYYKNFLYDKRFINNLNKFFK